MIKPTEHKEVHTARKMSDKSNVDEAKELDKFTKFLALKSAQIIVQSRLGEKIRTQCKPFSYSNKDWFNLAIDDLPDVLEKAKSAMCKAPPGSLPLPLCVEISLRTVDGDTMVLETWCVGVNPEEKDPSVRVAYTVYNRMGILLKSLVSVTRVTPAYKLSRRQGPDTYEISYRIYVGEPQYHLLGEGYSTRRVGQLGTPAGTIFVTSYYRTKMTISPQPSKDSSIMLKSDHFRPETGLKMTGSKLNDEKNRSFSDIPWKVGAFVDTSNRKDWIPEPEEIPFAKLLKLASVPIVPKMKVRPPKPDSDEEEEEEEEEESVEEKEDSANGNPSPKKSFWNDDYIMVELKTPFAMPNANTDLGVFYRECQKAPQLEGFEQGPSVADQLGDLTRQLEAFEVSLEEYDNVITEFCTSDNNN